MYTLKHRKAPRGVVLLVILGLLAMFGMVVLAFMLIAGHNRRSAEALQRVDEQAFFPREQCKQAFLQVARGSRSRSSGLRNHSLLEDMYGNRATYGDMAHGIPMTHPSFPDPPPTALCRPICGGQLIEFTAVYEQKDTTTGQQVHRWRSDGYRFLGCVLTMKEGPAAGRSTRAVFVADVQTIGASGKSRHYIINGAPFTGTGFGFNTTTGMLDALLPIPSTYDPFLQAAVFPPTFTVPYALVPNRAGDPADATLAGDGHANEEYDAVDYQNMLLAMMARGEDVNGNGTLDFGEDVNGNGLLDIDEDVNCNGVLDAGEDLNGNGQLDLGIDWVPIPSLHRPALVNYWYHRMVNDWLVPAGLSEVDAWRAVLQPVLAQTAGTITVQVRDAIIGLKRRIFFRPLPEVHDHFTGSNAQWMAWRQHKLPDGRDIFDPSVTAAEIRDLFWLQQSPVLNGPWDVDNDGDGRPDSIWVDLGMPIQQSAERRFKPLFAILCLDLDGRLNLNAHGCLAQTLRDTSGNPIYNQNVGSSPFVFAGGSSAAALPRGQGYGPPEVNLNPVLDSNLVQYQRLLFGGDIDPDATRVRWLDGRYGEAAGSDADADTVPDELRAVAPGESFVPADDLRDIAQMRLADDPLSRNKHFDFAALVSYSIGNPTSYGTPPDFKGTMAIGLDVRGQPMYWPMVDRAVNTHVTGSPEWWDRFAWPSVNDPYELNLSRNSARALKTPAPIDNPFTVFEFERLERQYDIDTGALPDRLAALAPALLGHRGEVTTESWDVPCPHMVIPPGTGAGVPARNFHFSSFLRSRLTGGIRNAPLAWSRLVAPELLAGLRMNLNRPFGNGLDDNGNGVVDEPGLIFYNGTQWVFNTGVPSEVADPTDPGNQALWEKIPLVDAAGNLITDGSGNLRIDFDHVSGIDVDGDGNADVARIAVDRALARQLYARQLYVLAILVSEDIYSNINTLKSTWDAERLAQWAVNVVDFRDRDSIMTRFNFDRNPLDGWNPAPGDVVWGCERPELLLSETLAFHDRRTEDLSEGDTVNDPSDPDDADEDFDQRVHPEGSLFVEFYNPWTGHELLPAEFCDRGGVMLNRVTPQGDPVWRLVIALPETKDSEGGSLDTPDDPAFVPRDPDCPRLQPKLDNVERTAYFVRPSGTYGYDGVLQYYPSNSDNIAPIKPGRYGVVGPGRPSGTSVTYIGFQRADPAPIDPLNPTQLPRRIELVPNANPDTPNTQVRVYSKSVAAGQWDEVVPGSPIPHQPAVAVVMDAVTTDTSPNTVPRFSVSEPLGGYRPYTDMANGQFQPPLDEPEDLDLSPDSLWERTDPDTGLAKGIKYDGTNRRFRVVYLQRLANPLAPWDATYNPYRTVDAAQVDLTVFNGITDPPLPDPTVVTPPAPPQCEEFYTVQRGANVHENTGTGWTPEQRHNIWAAEPERESVPPPTPPRGVHPEPAPHYFHEDFGHTLGRLNAWFGVPRDDPSGLYVGDPIPEDAVNAPTWPWLTWINRPFVNRMELLLVPVQRSSQLLRRFTVGREGNDPYRDDLEDPRFDPANPDNLLNPDQVVSFQHLVSLFGTPDPPPAGPGGPSPPDRAERLYRLLEFVDVPSRFVGTEIQGNPEVFAGPASWWQGPSVPFPFRPPYNGIPGYREPGRVNINTVFSRNVWVGLLDYFPTMTGTSTDYWQEMVASRRGYDPEYANLNHKIPTQYGNPLRSFAGKYLVPLDVLKTDVLGDDIHAIDEEIHATLLRRTVPDANPATPDHPLFRHEANQAADAFENTARNPYFRYQLLQRLAGVTTTRSNVYAVWITVGYFEVEQAPAPPTWTIEQYQAVYPQGYRLGQELGSDTGEIERHRAFYIFDRSIPVGFERGRDNNVEDAILLERFIE